MDIPGEQTVEAIAKELSCPVCEYSLRGLSGDVVECPECGQRCDAAALVTAQWKGKWYRAPGLTRLLWPITVLVMGGLLAFFFWLYTAMDDPDGIGNVGLSWLVVGATTLLWLGLFAGTTRAFVQLWRGPALALLGHALFFGFLAAVISLVAGAIYVSLSFRGHRWGASGLVLIAIGVFMLWGCRRGEKFIAACCIRQHLREKSRV